MIYRGKLHREIFERELRLHPMGNTKCTSALYLLTADNGLWKQVSEHVSAHVIDVKSMHPGNLSGTAYIFFSTAKDILNGTRNVSLTDMAVKSVLSPQNFLVLVTAMVIRGFGLNAAKRMATQVSG